MDPKNFNGKDKEKLEIIIETAFKLFIILKKYIDIDELDSFEKETDDESVGKEENEDLSLLKQEFDNILGENNIVGQISALGMDLIKTGFSAVESKILFLQ